MDRIESRAHGEEGTLPETTPLDHTAPPGGLPPHLVRNRPFLYLVLGEGIAGLAFWAYLPLTFSEASFRFHASPRQMAFLLASYSLPFILFNPLQGAVVDRWSPKWLNVCGYVALMIAIPLAMAATSLVWLYGSVFMIGVADAAIQPSRSALTGLLVPERLLVQANGVLWAAIHLALVIGPLGGGLLQRAYGNEAALTAALGVGALSLPFFLLVPDRRPAGERPTMRIRDLGEGFRTAVRERELRLLIGLAAALFLMITAFWALEPVFVRHTLHRGGDALSFLWAAHGVGAFLGAVAVSRIRAGTRRELLLVGAGLVSLGAGELAYAGAGMFGVALVGAAFMGTGLSFYFAPAMALIQRVAPERQRGRVTSAFGVLQETVGLTASLTVALVGLGVGMVRPALMGGGIFVAVAGLIGMRAFIRLRRTGGSAARPAARRREDGGREGGKVVRSERRAAG